MAKQVIRSIRELVAGPAPTDRKGLLPNRAAARSDFMPETIEALRERMESAVRVLDFEEAKRCRDKIAMIRGGASAEEAEEADFEGLERQRPGAMGLGTSQQRVTPPPGWKRPQKPDPMTAGRSSRRRPRKT